MTGTITVGGIAILVTACATLIAAVGGLILGALNRGQVITIRQLANGANEALRKRCAQLEQFIHEHGDIPPPDPALDDGPS